MNRTDRIRNEQPIADRLDRSYFGFDQEYFERMPLLINALQEVNYIDPPLEMSGSLSNKRRFNVTIFKTTAKPTFKPSPIRRTSPRPFYFEYRHPTPLPFSKTYGSRTWVERYRNEERLKNIRQIIKYLENTINAKVGDMHAKPTEKHIAFTGVYIEPMLENKSSETDTKGDLQAASSDNLKKFHVNHLADPLFNFKPENPGDVNLLADDFLRFSPIPIPSLIGKPNSNPVFRQIPFQNRNCQGNRCEENYIGNKLLHSSTGIKSTTTSVPPPSTTKSFSVMLNLYPITDKIENNKKELHTTTQPVDKIYLTTSRPLIQFKRKSNVSFRRVYTPYKRPRYLSKLINKDSKSNTTKDNKIAKAAEPDTQMIVHVKVYDEEETKNETSRINSTTFIPSTQTNPYTTKAPIEFSTSQIEDYHAGSSGYVPVVTKSDESLPKVTTMFPFFDTTTQPSSVIKFNVEDAKVPSHYVNLHKSTNERELDVNRRNSGEYVDHEKFTDETSENKNLSNNKHFERSDPIHVEPSTLIVKLRNELSKTTTQATEVTKLDGKIEETTTNVWTYVPQINGHYRSINQNSRNVNKWLNANPEVDRKKRLEMSVSGLNTYVPMYVEIKRNNTMTTEDQGDTNDDVED